MVNKNIVGIQQKFVSEQLWDKASLTMFLDIWSEVLLLAYRKFSIMITACWSFIVSMLNIYVKRYYALKCITYWTLNWMFQHHLLTKFRKEKFYGTNNKRTIWVICRLNFISFRPVERILEAPEVCNLFLLTLNIFFPDAAAMQLSTILILVEKDSTFFSIYLLKKK